ncbi:multidrug resistance-associated protein 4 [Elysia marginata]|uniref:Multidrug resistance-associated protein 4 n=1 Tax=Elysia marginata TaxID=1093978 RepID=A0AAV4JAM0_9GAST|nr:multidrug resistance-associated protein 4 [Elysia marginata]
MDESLRHVNPNPALKANIISKTFFWWLNPLFKRGYQTPLEESDLYNVCPSDASDNLGEKLRVQWEKQLKRSQQGKEPSLLRALAATFGFQYLLLGFVVALECLRLSNKAMNESSVGQIVNLMSNDVNRFDQAVIFLHFLWVGPLQALAVLIILWNELGPSVLAGFVVLLLLIPVQGFMGKLFSKLRHKTAVHTDERVKVMNEIISGMRVIKMYCWEKPFGQLVEKIRGQEVVHVKSSKCAQAGLKVPSFVWTRLMLLFVLFVVVAQGRSNALRPYVLYLTFGLFQAMRAPFTVYMQFAFQYIAEVHTVLKRVQISSGYYTFYRDAKPNAPDFIGILYFLWLELIPVRSARRAQAAIQVPAWLSTRLALLLLFSTLTVLGRTGSLRPYVVYFCFGMYQALRGSCTIYIFNAFQSIAEVRVVLRRVEMVALSAVDIPPSFIYIYIKKRGRLEGVQVWRTRRTEALILAPYFVSSKLALMLLYMALTAVGRLGGLRSYTVYLTVGLFQAFRLSCTLFVPFAFQHIAEFRVVLARVEVRHLQLGEGDFRGSPKRIP